MRKFLLRCLLFGILVVSACVVAYIMKPSRTSVNMAVLPYKLNMLDSTPGPRLIFVGGSNLAFGLDSKRISDSLNITTVNTGLHAGLGLRFQLNSVINRLKEGDIIVIMPEAANFYGGIDSDETGVLSLAMVCTSMKECKYLNARQIGKVIGGIGLALKYYYANAHSDTTDATDDIYGFNKYGDNEKHWEDTTKYKITVSRPSDFSLDNEAVDWLATRTLNLRKQGHKVILFPATMVESAYKYQNKRIRKYYKAMSVAGAPFMVGEAAHVMPDDYVYDTVNHLNKAGVDSLTTLLIKELRALGIGDAENR